MSEDADLTPLQRLWTLPDEVDGPWSARRELAAALRELIDRCVRTGADADAMAAARAHVEAATALLPQGGTAAEAFGDASYFERPAVYVDRGALVGRSNPIAPPMRIRWEARRSVCDVELGEAYVGAPGMVHGGMIAAVFDQLVGHCVIMNGRSGLTGKLSVEYPRPTRLHTPLRWEAWLVASEGRRLQLEATCTDSEGVTARAEALFVELSSERARAVIGAQRPPRS